MREYEDYRLDDFDDPLIYHDRGDDFIDHDIKENTVHPISDKSKVDRPKCPYCGTAYGMAFGTGDCGCNPDPE